MVKTVQDAVSLVRQGNNEGKTFLYEHTYKKAYYVALKYVKNDDDALDIVQDSYIKAFDRIDQLDNALKFESWLNTIVASTAMDYLRKKKPQLFTDMSGDDEEYDVADRFEADYSQQPEVVMDQNETSRLVQEIIGELSDEQRVCVTMYYMQEMSVKEISDVLDVSDNTVKSRLNYARKNIEAKVKELEKKGTKLYALAPIPFFVFLLGKEASACEATAAAGLYSAGAASSAGAGATTSTATGASGVSGTAGAGTSSGAAAGMSLGAKLAIGITAGVLAIGGAIGVGVAVSNSGDDTETEVVESVQDEDSSSTNTTTAKKKLPDDVTPVEVGGYTARIVDVTPQDDGNYIATVENLNTNVMTVTPEEYATYQVGSEKEFGDYEKCKCYKADNGYYFGHVENGRVYGGDSNMYWISDQHRDSNNNIVVYYCFENYDGNYYHPYTITDRNGYSTINPPISKICISKDANIGVLDNHGNRISTTFQDFVNSNAMGNFYAQSYVANYAGWRKLGHLYLYGDSDGYVIKLDEVGMA